MRFGEKVRDLRKKNSLTQDELAKCLGVSKRTIIGWERDGRYPRNVDILEGLNQISNALLRHQTTEEQYVGIFLQSKMIRDQLCFPNLWPIDTIRDKMCLPSVGLQEILLHVFA